MAGQEEVEVLLVSLVSNAEHYESMIPRCA
jgi:hypothetical protein